MPVPTTFLLDKGIVRGVFESVVRLATGRRPIAAQLQAISVYQALLTTGSKVCVTPETANSARRRDERIATVLLNPLVLLTPGRYLRRRSGFNRLRTGRRNVRYARQRAHHQVSGTGSGAFHPLSSYGVPSFASLSTCDATTNPSPSETLSLLSEE